MTTDSPCTPIFTFGFERSGTTLLSMVLSAHPDLAVPFSPTGLWYRYGSALTRYNHLREQGDRVRLIHDLLQEERIRLWDATLDAERVLERVEDGGYDRVIRVFHELYAEHHQKPRWALHDISTITDMHLANRWFPDALFLHIVRDVRDIALSHKHYRFGSSNSCEVAFAWREAVRTNLMMGRILGSERYQVIKFEDLIQSPEDTLLKVCEFMGLRFTARMLSYSGEVERKVPDSKRDLWPALGGELDSGKIGRWRGALRSYEVAAINDICGDLVDDLGYQVESESATLSKEAYMLGSVLSRGGRFARLWRRLRRYGGTESNKRPS